LLFEIENVGAKYSVSSHKIMPRPAADLGLLEKDIEEWIADHPEVLLPNEQVLVIEQSITGQSMADVLVLDSFGRLIIVEIKRHQTDRKTVAQLLEYAARLRGVSYEELNSRAQRYRKWQGGDLHSVFSDFFKSKA
jgi:RecB family endonuclease NucS